MANRRAVCVVVDTPHAEQHATRTVRTLSEVPGLSVMVVAGHTVDKSLFSVPTFVGPYYELSTRFFTLFDNVVVVASPSVKTGAPDIALETFQNVLVHPLRVAVALQDHRTQCTIVLEGAGDAMKQTLVEQAGERVLVCGVDAVRDNIVRSSTLPGRRRSGGCDACGQCDVPRVLFIDLGMQPAHHSFRTTTEMSRSERVLYTVCPECFHVSTKAARASTHPPLALETYIRHHYLTADATVLSDSRLSHFEECTVCTSSEELEHACSSASFDIVAIETMLHCAKNPLQVMKTLAEGMGDETVLFVSAPRLQLGDVHAAIHCTQYFNVNSMKWLCVRAGLYMHRATVTPDGRRYVFEVQRTPPVHGSGVGFALYDEMEEGRYSLETYDAFRRRFDIFKNMLVNEIEQYKLSGSRVVGVGVGGWKECISLVNVAGLDSRSIDCILVRDPDIVPTTASVLLPGTDIPCVGEVLPCNGQTVYVNLSC